MVLGHNDALACRQSIGLEHHGSGAGFDKLTGGVRIRERLPGRGRNPVTVKKGFGKAFRTLQLCRPRARPKAGQAGIVETVNNAVHEWCLRSDNREVDLMGLCCADQGVNIVRRNRQVFDTRLC